MSTDDPRFEIQDEELTTVLRKLGMMMDRALKDATATRDKKWGFGLFLFEFDGEACFWISSGQRQDMMKFLREFIQREEAQ